MKEEGGSPVYENTVAKHTGYSSELHQGKADEISIEIAESATSDQYLITITDNGKGIPGEILKNCYRSVCYNKDQKENGTWSSPFKVSCGDYRRYLEIASEQEKGQRYVLHFQTVILTVSPGRYSRSPENTDSSKSGIDFNYYSQY